MGQRVWALTQFPLACAQAIPQILVMFYPVASFVGRSALVGGGWGRS
jgi:hypothetical protein